MKRKRDKDYWVKKTERYPDVRAAQDRAGALRLHEHTSHIKVQPTDDGAEVSYSVAGWYLEELEKAGLRL
jgi:hypothetical protein